MFWRQLLTDALRQALARSLAVTHDASALEALGLSPRLVEGRADNIETTRPQDLDLAEFYLKRATP